MTVMEHSTRHADNDPRSNYHSESWKALHQVPVIDFLSHDKRPTFVFDLQEDSTSRDLPIYINPALCKSDALFNVVGQRSPHQFAHCPGHESFLEWAAGSNAELSSSEFQFGGFNWGSTTLNDRWRVVVAASTLSGQHHSDGRKSLLSDSEPESGCRVATETSKVSLQSNGTPKSHVQARDFFLDDSPKHGVHPTTSDANQLSTSGAPSAEPSKVFTDTRNTVQHRHTPSSSARRNAEMLTKIAGFEAFGIYFTDVKGEIIFCSDTWYEITRLPRDQTNAMAWTMVVADDELPRIMELWSRLVVHKESIHYEARLKRPWKPPAGLVDVPEDFPTWVSGWTYPDISASGDLIGVYGALSDISKQKWTEHLIGQKLAHAIERASLVEQLSLRAKQVADSEERFRRLSDMSESFKKAYNVPPKDSLPRT